MWFRKSGDNEDTLSGTTGDKPLTSEDSVPWWVNVFTNWGRPLAAGVVLVLCAPGEQHLAKLSGWNGGYEWLSWGAPALFSMYAGIAAIVATKMPEKKSAVWGAGISLLLAMAAQPISHLFVTGWLSATPRTPWILVVAVSVVPPFVLGHLLHLAASSKGQRVRTGTTGQSETVVLTREDRTTGQASAVLEDSGRKELSSAGRDNGTAEDKKFRDAMDKLMSEVADTGAVLADTSLSLGQKDSVRPDWLYGTNGVLPQGQDGDAMHWTLEDNVSATNEDTADKGTRRVPVVPQRDSELVPAPRPRNVSNLRPSMREVAQEILRDNPNVTDEDIRTVLLDKFGSDSKPNSLSKAISRARDNERKTA